MQHHEFRIGQPFLCGGKRWRCTDIGTRAIVAICLEPHEVVSTENSEVAESEHHTVTDDPSWFTGPPYAVVEEVFDEYDLDVCSPMNGESNANRESDG